MCLFFHGIQKNAGLIHLFANECVPMALFHSSLMASLPLIMSLLLLTLNVNGLRCANKRLSFIHWLHSLNPDFVCLQELHLRDNSEALSWFSSSGYSCLVSAGSTKSAGVAILYRPSFTVRQCWKDQAGRFISAEFQANSSTFRVVSLYAPNRNPARNLFFEDISSHLDATVPTILTGDFNSVFDPTLDRRGPSSLSSSAYRESSLVVSNLFTDLGVVDIWRQLHPGEAGFTWTRPDGVFASRIDLIGCPSSWTPFVSSSFIHICPLSDHDAVTLSFSPFSTYPRGRGYWKLNASVLDEPDYIQAIHSFWSSWSLQKASYHSLQNWWDMGKLKIKYLTMKYCSSRSKRKLAIRTALENRASLLKTQIDNGQVSCIDDYKEVINQLNALNLEDAKGAQIRSRARWCEEGETSSSYFFRLEKKRARDSWISNVKLPDDSYVSDLPDVMSAWSSFYKDLFTSVETDRTIETDLLSSVQSSLGEEEAATCEGLLSLEEIHIALKGMAHRKTPGSDGLPMEFYLAFWDLLGTDLLAVLNRAHVSGVLSLSQRRGIICLIFKKGDRSDMANWRPITLLNVDYKIASRAIAGRLLRVIHLVVSPDQTCGVPGRFIGENVRLMQDVISYCNHNDFPLAILSLDQEKAFDRVEWSFLIATLEKMGFGPSFVQWIRTFYTCPQSSVLVNGYLSENFSLSRGVRQGCPLSPLLYVLVAEVLACNVRASPTLQGVHLPGSPSSALISQYADDTSIFVTSDDHMREIFDIYAKYERGSGAKLNLAKCKGLWVGAWRDRNDPPVNLRWSSVKIRALGVTLGNDDLADENWTARIESFSNVLSSWSQRSLSYHGKALVSNALALSGLWYVASLLPLPTWALKEINKHLFSFFWKGKKELVARTVVVQPPSKGGFNVIDVSLKVQALHAQWVKRYLVSPSKWSILLAHWSLQNLGATLEEVLSNPSVYDLDLLPPFYRSVVRAWSSLRAAFLSPHESFATPSGSASSRLPAAAMSTKSCYQHLLQQSASPPHCILHFQPDYGGLYWPETWQQVSICPIDRPVIDLNWKIAHGVLYTASRLASFGYLLDNSCFCGFPLESLSHLFFACPLAQSVINWVQALLWAAIPVAPTLASRHLLFGFNDDELLAVPPVFSYLLNVSKYYIWLARNDFRFRAVRPGAIEVISSIKNRLKFILLLFFKRFKSPRRRRFFNRCWGASSVVARVVGDRLILKL